MKTQLLEDIGQSAALPLTPTKTAGQPKAGKEVHKLAPAENAEPARSRSTPGVWRQKPAGEPLVSTSQQPEQQPPPLDLDKVFEEIAALEAQYVPPGQQLAPALAPALAPVEPQHTVPAPPAAPPAEPLHQPAIPPDEATLAPKPTHTATATAPQDPLFDFTIPLPEGQAADPFKRAPSVSTRSRRYLLWAACLLSAVLLIQGGRWLYQERNDAGALALVANEAKQAPQADKAVQQRAIAAKESTPEPGAAVRAGGDLPVTPAAPASRVPAAPPPLVLLEPEPSTAARADQTPPSVAGREAPRTAPKPDPVAKQEPASPVPKPSSRRARERSRAAAEAARERRERERVRQLARASAMETEKPSGPDTTMAATLRACREHGYHAAQCIKQGCSVGKYGFVCHGR